MPFDPTHPTSANLLLDFDPNVLGLSDGNPIATYTDPYTARVATAAGSAQPTFKAAIVNGLPVARFNGSGNVLTIPNDSGLQLTQLHAFVVMNRAGAGSGNGWFLFKNANSSSGTASYWFGENITGRNLPDVGLNLTGSGTDNFASTGPATGTWTLVEANYDQTNVRHYLNGSTNGVNSNPGAIVTTTGALTLGGYNASFSSAEFLDGDIARILLYDGPLSPTDQLYVENNLANIYNLYSVQSFTLSPASGNAGVSVSVTATGSLTAWTSGTTFSVSGGTGASISGTSVNVGAQTATFTLNPGSTAATLTISDSTDSATAPFVALPVPTIAPNSAAILYSPYGWIGNGAVYNQTNAAGSYFRTNFTGTSFTLFVDVTPEVNSGGIVTLYPTIAWSIDSGAWQTLLLTSSTQTITMATGLASGTHTVQCYVKTIGNGDRWIPFNVVRITGFTAASVSAPAARPKVAIFFGDSITEGALAGSDGNPDTLAHYAAALGEALNAEWGNIGYGGQGWAVGGSSNVPPFITPGNSGQTTWNQYSSGRSRLVGGLLSPAPDYVFVNQGTADRPGNSGTTTDAQAWLTAVRAAAPLARIFMIVPFGQFCQTQLLAAFNGYGGGSASASYGVATIYTAVSDSKAHLIDLGATAAEGLGALGGATIYSPESIHPDFRRHGQLGAMLALAVEGKLAAGGGGSVIGSSFIRGVA